MVILALQDLPAWAVRLFPVQADVETIGEILSLVTGSVFSPDSHPHELTNSGFPPLRLSL
jgi:hypothetical protein